MTNHADKCRNGFVIADKSYKLFIANKSKLAKGWGFKPYRLQIKGKYNKWAQISYLALTQSSSSLSFVPKAHFLGKNFSSNSLSCLSSDGSLR
jgi:hypothetical protein